MHSARNVSVRLEVIFAHCGRVTAYSEAGGGGRGGGGGREGGGGGKGGNKWDVRCTGVGRMGKTFFLREMCRRSEVFLLWTVVFC